MPAPAHIQASTLESFIEAWKRWSAQDMLAVFSDNFTQTTMPFALGIPVRSKSEVEAVLPKLIQTVTNYKLTIQQIVHDPGRNKAAIYAMSTGDTPFGPWALEYAAFCTFDEAGEKIAKVEEMLDSAFMRDFGPKFHKYLSENGGH
ncbi:Monooxygenase AgnL5 [Trapelia coarctata]|nr:Monooxygenase AgnL5 [Trapelia coarctata]